MINAADIWNPTSIGTVTKFKIHPRFRSPNNREKVPIEKERPEAMRAGGTGNPSAVIDNTTALVSRLKDVVGPVAISFDVPMKKYITDGSQLAKSPCCNGMPASAADARAWGIKTNATVTPAIISSTSHLGA